MPSSSWSRLPWAKSTPTYVSPASSRALRKTLRVLRRIADTAKLDQRNRKPIASSKRPVSDCRRCFRGSSPSRRHSRSMVCAHRPPKAFLTNAWGLTCFERSQQPDAFFCNRVIWHCHSNGGAAMQCAQLGLAKGLDQNLQREALWTDLVGTRSNHLPQFLHPHLSRDSVGVRTEWCVSGAFSYPEFLR